MTGRADEIFKRIKVEGIELIHSYITNQVIEDLFLDYKRSSTDGQGSAISDNDRKTYGKAISGFSNSEGGVIVWGVDCRKVNNGDVPTGIVPIENPIRFKTWLENAGSGLTIPPHRGIEHIHFETCKGNGLVVSLIPKSDHAPHQTVGDLRYYMRAGSNFVHVPHAVLAGMFGRRPEPNIGYRFAIAPAIFAKDKGIIISLGLILKNIGRGMARYPFLNIDFRHPGSQSTINLTHMNHKNWHYSDFLGVQISAISNSVLIPPNAYQTVAVVELNLQSPFSTALEIFGECGAEGCHSTPFQIKIQSDELEQGYKMLRTSHGSKIDENNASNFILSLFERCVDLDRMEVNR